MTSGDALQQALRAEHAAIFGYGVLGAHLAGAERATAIESDAAHRGRRDFLAGLLIARKLEPAPMERSYAVPAATPAAADARTLAVTIEERTAAAWRAAVPELAGEERRYALNALADCAVRAARWRAVANPSAPATVAFPGR